MYALLRIISDRSGIAPQLIATRDDLLDLAMGHEGCRLASGWRHELAGALLERLLTGEIGLTVKEGASRCSRAPSRAIELLGGRRGVFMSAVGYKVGVIARPMVSRPLRLESAHDVRGTTSRTLLIVVISMVLGVITQGYINSAYNKWSQVPTQLPGTGADVARRMLDSNGAGAVGITQIAGRLTDNYDPRDNKLHLSADNYTKGSVASVAVACHEAGHAIQNATGYRPCALRTSLVPAVTFASQTWGLLLHRRASCST